MYYTRCILHNVRHLFLFCYSQDEFVQSRVFGSSADYWWVVCSPRVSTASMCPIFCHPKVVLYVSSCAAPSWGLCYLLYDNCVHTIQRYVYVKQVKNTYVVTDKLLFYLNQVTRKLQVGQDGQSKSDSPEIFQTQFKGCRVLLVMAIIYLQDYRATHIVSSSVFWKDKSEQYCYWANMYFD